MSNPFDKINLTGSFEWGGMAGVAGWVVKPLQPQYGSYLIPYRFHGGVESTVAGTRHNATAPTVL
jgi:hypothetical protein